MSNYRNSENYNYKIAYEHFISTGELPPIGERKGKWTLHHKDIELITKDPERYAQWRIEDLIPLPFAEHQRVHMEYNKAHGLTGKYAYEFSDQEKEHLSEVLKGRTFTEEHKKHLSESLKGKLDNKGEKNPMYGKHHSEEAKKKISAVHKGVKTKGSTGMHWFTNGIVNVMDYECPEGFYKGRHTC